MSGNIIQEMYGLRTLSEDAQPLEKLLTEATNEFEIKTQGKNFARLKQGKEVVEVPRARYVKELEDKVTKLQSELKKTQGDNRRLRTAVDSLSRDMTDVFKQLKGKMDRF